MLPCPVTLALKPPNPKPAFCLRHPPLSIQESFCITALFSSRPPYLADALFTLEQISPLLATLTQNMRYTPLPRRQIGTIVPTHADVFSIEAALALTLPATPKSPTPISF